MLLTVLYFCCCGKSLLFWLLLYRCPSLAQVSRDCSASCRLNQCWTSWQCIRRSCQFQMDIWKLGFRIARTLARLSKCDWLLEFWKTLARLLIVIFETSVLSESKNAKCIAYLRGTVFKFSMPASSCFSGLWLFLCWWRIVDSMQIDFAFMDLWILYILSQDGRTFGKSFYETWILSGVISNYFSVQKKKNPIFAA